jgi:hypothetical protein
VRSELEIVRDALEVQLTPAVGTGVLFEALDRWGRGVPETLEHVLEILRGPLAALLTERYSTAESRELVRKIEVRLGVATDALEVDVDFSEEEPQARTTQMAAVTAPVSVLVLSATQTFGERLLTVLGDDRVYPYTAADEAAFRHATFSTSPLLAIVDATNPPFVRPSALAAALRSLPDRTLAVVWAVDSDFGRELRARLEHKRIDAVYLERTEGIEPLLDLVLARFRVSSIPPPP